MLDGGCQAKLSHGRHQGLFEPIALGTTRTQDQDLNPLLRPLVIGFSDELLKLPQEGCTIVFANVIRYIILPPQTFEQFPFHHLIRHISVGLCHLLQCLLETQYSHRSFAHLDLGYI